MFASQRKYKASSGYSYSDTFDNTLTHTNITEKLDHVT